MPIFIGVGLKGWAIILGTILTLGSISLHSLGVPIVNIVGEFIWNLLRGTL